MSEPATKTGASKKIKKGSFLSPNFPRHLGFLIACFDCSVDGLPEEKYGLLAVYFFTTEKVNLLKKSPTEQVFLLTVKQVKAS